MTIAEFENSLDSKADASLFAAFTWARKHWNLNIEPDYELIRAELVKEWGPVFLAPLPYFDVCMDQFRVWEIIKVINYDFADPVEFINHNRLKTIVPSFSIEQSYNKILAIRGREGATSWLRKMLETISRDGAGELQVELPSLLLDKNDTWEPLPIDRSNPKYEETIVGIENAIQAIAADNGFSATYPDERDNLVEHATATLKSAKEGKISKNQVRENWIVAGIWISATFGASVIGGFGAKLAELGLRGRTY